MAQLRLIDAAKLLGAMALAWSCTVARGDTAAARYTEAQALHDAVYQTSLAISRMQELRQPMDFSACVRVLESQREYAWRVRDQHFFLLLARCKYADPSNGKLRIAEPELRAWLAPWWQHLRADERATPTIQMEMVFGYMRLLQDMGREEDAQAYLMEALAERVAGARATPADEKANAELVWLARALFGNWGLQGQIRGLQAYLERELGEAHRASLILLRNLAYHERFLGRPVSALAYIERAAALTRQALPDDALLNAHMATEHAACLSSAGRTAEAMGKMLAARPVFEAQRPSAWTNLMRIDYNLAGMALDIGDYEAAVSYADRAIATAQHSGDRILIDAESKVPMATREVARMALGMPDAAGALKSVLESTRGYEMHIGSQAFSLALHAARVGDTALLAWAADFADQHIRRYRGPVQADRALQALLQAWRKSGYALDSESVRDSLDMAAVISLSGRSQSTIALTHFNLARHLAGRDANAAIWLYKRGANALQALRGGLSDDRGDLYRAWLGAYEQDLRDYIALLIARGRLPEAEQALALLRDEEMFEYTRRAPRRGAVMPPLSYNGVERQGNQWLSSLAERVEASARSADARLDQGRRTYLLSNYEDETAHRQIAGHQTEFHRGVSAQFQHATEQRAMSPAKAVLVAGVPPRHARLSYFVNQDAIEILVQTARGRHRQRMPIIRAELFRDIQAARSLLASPQGEPREALRALYLQLLAPIRPWLQRARVTSIEFVPDSALRYLPFGALFDGRRYLVEDFTITNVLGNAVRAKPVVSKPLAGGARSPGLLLALGRSVGDVMHSALPGVEKELDTLRKAGGRIYLDSQFSGDSLAAELQRKPRVVHVASHFVLDPAGEEKSYLLLGDGQQLSLAQLKLLPWSSVQLAFLSACDSAVLVEQGDGRELAGFASALMAAGARNVLATLWRVADGATAQWASEFYAPLRAGARATIDPRPAWVARTQRQWLHKYRGTPYAHPHYWAAFVWLSAGV